MQQPNDQGGKASPFPTSKKWSGYLTSVNIAAWLSIVYGAALLGLFPLWLVSILRSYYGLALFGLPFEIIIIISLLIFGPFRNIKAGILLVKGKDRGRKMVIDTLFFDTLLLIIYFGYYGIREGIIEKIRNQPYILIPILLLYHAALLWSLRNSKKHLRKAGSG